MYRHCCAVIEWRKQVRCGEWEYCEAKKLLFKLWKVSRAFQFLAGRHKKLSQINVFFSLHCHEIFNRFIFFSVMYAMCGTSIFYILHITWPMMLNLLPFVALLWISLLLNEAFKFYLHIFLMAKHYFPLSFHIMLLSDFEPSHKNANMKVKKHQTPFQRWLLMAIINIIN